MLLESLTIPIPRPITEVSVHLVNCRVDVYLIDAYVVNLVVCFKISA